MRDMDLFDRDKEPHNFIEGIETKHVILVDISKSCTYNPAVVILNEDKTKCLMYINDESYYPALYSVVQITDEGACIRGEYIEDYTDRSIGHELIISLKKKGFEIVDIRSFKRAMLKFKCVNETKQYMERMAKEFKAMQDNLADVFADDGIRTAKCNMEDIVERTDGFKLETLGYTMRDLEQELCYKESGKYRPG